jgi:hypothetical protein
MARIAQITAGRDAAQTALTAGALKPSADRLLRHSTSAEVYRDWFLSNQLRKTALNAAVISENRIGMQHMHSSGAYRGAEVMSAW